MEPIYRMNTFLDMLQMTVGGDKPQNDHWIIYSISAFLRMLKSVALSSSGSGISGERTGPP
jgi:hypothetical protein